MNSKICNAEISQVLEKQAGAECVEEVIAAKQSVANKNYNTEYSLVPFTEEQAGVRCYFLSCGWCKDLTL